MPTENNQSPNPSKDMSKYKVIQKSETWQFICPVKGAFEVPRHGRWNFNGDFENPSFAPAIRIMAYNGSESKQNSNLNVPVEINHFFITKGKIQYLKDCTHKQASKTLELLTISKADQRKWFNEDGTPIHK